MRKLFTLIFFVVLTQNSGYAQTAVSKSRFGYGVLGGVDIFGTYQDGVRIKKVSGGMIGADFSYSIGSRNFRPTVHFQPNWEQFSYRVDYGLDPSNFLFPSINLPVLIRQKLANTKRLAPFFEFGVSYKSRLKSYFSGKEVSCGIGVGMSCFEYPYEELLVDPSRKGEVVIIVGAGVELSLNKVKVPVAIRLNDGVGTFTMNYSRPQQPIAGLKTQTIQILTGITF